jgi:FkbM family methyltransferase
MIVDVTEFTTADLYFGSRAYEPATTEYLLRRLPPGGVFVDIGANHGYFTVLAAARVGDRGRVIAFEPNPAVFEQLVAHVELNRFAERTVLLQQALSNRPDDRATLFVSQCPTNSGLSTLIPEAARVVTGAISPQHTVEVRTETFDRWFEASGLDRVDVVKIDTEGYEDHVIDGMAASLHSHRVGTIICETHCETDGHRTLCAAGYVPHLLEAAGPVANIAYVSAD